MRKTGLLIAMVLVVGAGACKRTGNGDVVVERPGDIDVKTTTDTIHMPKAPDVDIGSKKDTMIVNKPTVTMKPDTLVVKKPTVTVKKGGG